MFDLRYHVASLAAVFFALVIGILVGVALASHGLGNSDRLNYQRQIAAAQGEIQRLNGQVTTLSQSAKAGTSFLTNAYAAVMGDRLRGKKIAVLSIGAVDQKLRADVTRTVGDAGGTVFRLRALTMPLNLQAVDRALLKHRRLASYARNPNDIGRELADELVAGGDAPLWTAVEQQLVEEQSGSPKQPADGVVVLRSAGVQTDGTTKFLKGLLGKLGPLPGAVVAEPTGAKPSFLSFYSELGLSTVDDVDTPAGRIALAVALSGATPPDSHYGTRASDTDVVPDVPALHATTSTTGG